MGKEIYKEQDLYSEKKTDQSLDANLYEGKVEQLHENWKNNGFVKVRVPVIHGDTPIDRIPWARLSIFLQSACREWDNPMEIEYFGTLDESDLNGEFVYSGQGTMAMTCTYGTGNGATTLNGTVSTTKLKGEIKKIRLTPKPYMIWPYQQIRTGEGLLRVGDSVIVHVLNGNADLLYVSEIYKLGG